MGNDSGRTMARRAGPGHTAEPGQLGGGAAGAGHYHVRGGGGAGAWQIVGGVEAARPVGTSSDREHWPQVSRRASLLLVVH